MSNQFLERKIGTKTVVVSYNDAHPEALKYATKKLNDEEAAYLDACETADAGLAVLINELEMTHLKSQELKQKTCMNCGHQTLKERRDRMKVFGGLFWTNSKVSPFKHCENCGNEQENNHWEPVDELWTQRMAEQRINRAKKLRAKYEDD